MRALEDALNDGMNPERTRALLIEFWKRHGGTDELLQRMATLHRSNLAANLARTDSSKVPELHSDQSKPESPSRRKQPADAAQGVLHQAQRMLGVALAIAQVDYFIQEDRPRIREAHRLASTKDELLRMSMEHMTLHPADLPVGKAFMVLQERLFESSLKLGSAPATGLFIKRSGPPIAYLARLVIGALRPSGFDWPEIAELVDDGKGMRGRAERLSKLHRTDPLRGMRQRLQRAAQSGQTGINPGEGMSP